MTNIDIDLKGIFLNKYDKISTIQPVHGQLAIAKNDKFYWLYYVGMGQTEYHEIPDMEQAIIKALLDDDVFKVSKKVQALPLIENDNLVGEIRFRALVKS